MTTPPDATAKKTPLYLRLDPAIRDWIDRQARSRYMTANGYMTQMVLEAMKREGGMA
jgi:hypothetical protein